MEYTESLLKNGLLDAFHNILKRKPHDDLIENIAYCMANMMSFEHLKDIIRKHESFEKLVSCTNFRHMGSKLPENLATVMAWLYSNSLFAPYPDRNMGFHLVVWLCEIFIQYPENDEIVSESCWGILEFLKAEPDSSQRRAILYEKRAMKLVAKTVDSSEAKLQQVALTVLELYSDKNNNYEQLTDFIDIDIVAVD